MKENEPNMKCRVCDKDYFCCTDSRKYGAYKSMACSPECYKEYMIRIEKSRSLNPKVATTKRNSNPKTKEDEIETDNKKIEA